MSSDRPLDGVVGLTEFTFTGQQVDSVTGLMYYNARWYDPAAGRFISPDTIVPNPGNPQAFNRYSYVYNNPLGYTDPSGHGIMEDMMKFFNEAGNALAQGWTNLTHGVEGVKGIATYGPYLVYPYDTCIGPVGCWGGIEYASSLYAESSYQRRSNEQKYTLKIMSMYSNDEGWVTDSVAALIAISNHVAQQTGSTSDYMNDMALLILGFEHTAGTVLPMFERGAGLQFNSTGFGEHFRDPSIANNQVNHLWFFVHAGYQFGHFEEGDAMVRWFAQLHEIEGLPLIGAAGGGGSMQDYQLSLFGIHLGKMLRNGEMDPDFVGTWFNAFLRHPYEE